MQEYERLTAAIDGAKSNASRAAGALEQLQQEMERKFGVATVEEAERMLADMLDKRKELVVRYEKAKRRFERLCRRAEGDGRVSASKISDG